MSVELHIFMPPQTVLAVGSWQRSIEAAGFPTILDVAIDVESHRGFLPAKYGGAKTGFEFSLHHASELLAVYPHVTSIVADRMKCATFRWGGDPLEMCAALSSAASLAKLTEGLYFYPDDGVLYEGDEALIATRSDLSPPPQF